jgi:ribokinase
MRFMADPVILVAGSLHLDVLVAAPHLPRMDETVTGLGVTYAFGGKGGNQAVACARMGADAHMAGAVGSDDFAATILSTLDREGVDRGQVARVEGASGMSVAITEPGGGYGAVIVSGANLAFDPARVAFPRGCDILMLQNEIPAEANLFLARRAASAGIRVVLNAAPARAMDADLLALTDLLVVNRGEAAALTGQDEDALSPMGTARSLEERIAGHAIITLGGQGCAFADDIHAALDVPVISTHGAGDAFAGALATLWAQDATLQEAITFAQAAAALHVATPVDQRHGITAAKVRLFL